MTGTVSDEEKAFYVDLQFFSIQWKPATASLFSPLFVINLLSFDRLRELLDITRVYEFDKNDALFILCVDFSYCEGADRFPEGS